MGAKYKWGNSSYKAKVAAQDKLKSLQLYFEDCRSLSPIVGFHMYVPTQLFSFSVHFEYYLNTVCLSVPQFVLSIS